MKRTNCKRGLALLLAAGICLLGYGCTSPEEDISSGSPSSGISSSEPDIIVSSQPPKQEETSSIQAPRVIVASQIAEHIQRELATPVFADFAGAEELNDKIRQQQNDDLEEIAGILEDYAEPPESPFFYRSVFDYQENGLLSVCMFNEDYTGGAHGMHWITSYNLDPATGVFYEFRDLFRDPDTAVQTATAKIEETIRSFDLDETMAAGAMQTVQEQNGNYSYYLSGDQLVIYYQPYDIAPYAAGLIRIPIPLSELGETVVPLRHTSERASVRVNGKDTSVSRKLLLNENGDATVLLPMPEIARLCNVEATIKNESCMIVGKEYDVTYANGGAYISLYDFLDAVQNDVPGCLVIYGDDDVLRMYTET